MTQDDNDKIKSAVEAEAMKNKLDQLDRTMKDAESKVGWGITVVVAFTGINAILVTILISLGVSVWTAITDMEDSIAALKSELGVLQASLGEAPHELKSSLTDLDLAIFALKDQASRMEMAENSLSRVVSAARELETNFLSPIAPWTQDIDKIRSDVEAIKGELLPPDREIPARGLTRPKLPPQ
jgi:hypothetical protein